MLVQINGEPQEVEIGATVADLLHVLGLDLAAPGIAVAVNWDVVTRRRWTETVLADGDRVELIRATQGG